jgi:hypothetical protein
MPSNVPASRAHRASTRNTVKFTTGAVLTTFEAPPAGFDPLTADPSTLNDHGYPDRPTEPAALAEWKVLLGTPLRHFKPTITRRKDRRPSSVMEGPFTSGIWSGAVATTSSAPVFFTVAGRWEVPRIAKFANGDDRQMSAWVGIDGFNNRVLFQAGIHAVMSAGDDHPEVYAWIEWLPDSENEVGLPVAVGDTMSCVVTRDQEILSGDPVQQGQWDTIDDDHRLVVMHDGKVLDWKPDDGTWRLWNYDPAAAKVLTGPVSHGQWASIRDGHTLIAMHDGKVLDWVSGTGDWRLWNYVPGNHEDCLPGNPVSHGNWSSVRDGHVLVPMKDGKVIDWVPDDGTWRLWNYVPTNLQDCLPINAVSTGRWSSLDDDHTLVAMKDGRVIDWVSDGSWRLWNYDPADKQDCLPANAVAVGQWNTIDDDHTLLAMHDGRVLDWDTDGRFRLFHYSPEGRSTVAGTVVLRNETQGLMSTFHMQAPEGGRLKGQTAEWVVERPSENHVPTPLADYGKVVFTHAHASKVGEATPVKASAGGDIEMIENGQVVSQGNAAGETVTCTFV